MTTTFTFKATSGDLVLDESQIVSFNPVRVHTGKADLKATVEHTKALEDYAKRQNRLNIDIDNTTQWTGYLLEVNHNENRGTTSIFADGIAKKLEENRPSSPVTYTSIALEDAIRDYWGKTSFSNFSVTNQSTELVSDDEEIQRGDDATSFGNITNISNTTPIGINTFGNGNLNLLQTGHFWEGETASGIYTVIDGADKGGGWDFSNFEAALLDDELDNVNDNFTLNYRVPDDAPFPYYYVAFNSFEGDIVAEIDTVEIYRQTFNGFTDGLAWRAALDALITGYDPGTYNLEIRVENYVGGEVYLDCFTFTDDRYYNFGTWDTTTNAFSALDDPQLFKPQPVLFDNALTSYNIEDAGIFTNLVNTTNPDELAVSFDGGSTFSTITGTSAHTFANTGASRQVRARVTLGNYTSDSTTTPATGDAGQQLSVYTLDVDLNNLVVIDNLELSRNHFENLKTLHTYGDFLWVIEHDSSSLDNLVVRSFYRGDETRSTPSELNNPQNQSPTVKGQRYFNSVYVEGALDSNGDRPSAEVKDNTAIANDDREISPGVLRDTTVTTEAGAAFRASSILRTAQKNAFLVGTVTVPPILIHPGYARTIDFGDGDVTRTVERVSLQERQGQVQSQIEFVVDTGFAEELSRLKRNAAEIGDQV